MYESELMSKVKEGKEYKTEILEEFVFRNHYHIYSKAIGRNLYIGGQAICVVKKVIEADYQFLNDNGNMIYVESIKGIAFAELKL